MDESKLSDALRAAVGEVNQTTPAEVVAARARRRLRRNALISSAAVVVMLAGVSFGYEAFKAEHPVPLSEGDEGPVVHTARSKDGTLQCTATLPATVIEPGDPTGITLSTRNASDSTIRLQTHLFGLIRVFDDDGSLLEASTYGGSGGGPHLGPPPLPTELSPGESVRHQVVDVFIRWPGGLRVEAVCSTLDPAASKIAPFDVDVTVPGPAPEASDAMARALDASDGLFEKCEPKADGSWTNGLVEAPVGSYAPMTARCSAEIEESLGFTVVALRFVAPASAPEVEFAQGLRSTELPGEASMSIARWTFVVTAADIKEVEPVSGVARTRGTSGFSVGISHGEAGWAADMESICGGRGFYRGIIVISPCPP